MDALSYVMMALTLPVAYKVHGNVRRAWRGRNPFHRWLAVVWWTACLPVFLLEAALGLAGGLANLVALAAVAYQLALTGLLWRYTRQVGLPARAARPAREHVAAMGFLGLAYAPLAIWPTGSCVGFLLFSGAWLMPAVVAIDRGRQVWEKAEWT